MNKSVALIGLAILATTAVSAEARDRFTFQFFAPWHDREAYVLDDNEDDAVVYDEEYDDRYDGDVIVRPRNRAVSYDTENELWWLDDNARVKLEKRSKDRKPAVKRTAVKLEPLAKPKLKAAALPKTKLAMQPELQTASLTKPTTVVKAKTSPVVTKTIGCTAGAAVVTGYGFGAVKPKVCTGNTYAYSAARGGKVYEIKLTAASGEITDVKKLN